ncbi:MAG: hypothetical protein EXR79_17515 [Myxococcales bacterium]|nr:hypothetical protein [Myxococcales bacterium]
MSTVPGLWLVRTDAWGDMACASSGDCAAKQPVDCNDGNPCTADLCTAGQCKSEAIADGSVCGAGKTCTAGVCK